KDNQLKFSKEGWVYSSSAAGFMLILNDSNEGQDHSAIINPIDTLPRKNKFSGDYIEDKRNFIAIRDTKSPAVYAFFIHFEKDNGACTGELKGEMKLNSPNSAQFTENGDPCVIDFHFDGRDVTLKERGSCGNHRGIKCYFDDTFTKKREPRQARK
ncbi:MAG TPA: hypothetical protein VG842_01150, partial [Sediminibacterium sp.]|nr:hypothetical protein [Sediminibacterium sp.]